MQVGSYKQRIVEGMLYPDQRERRKASDTLKRAHMDTSDSEDHNSSLAKRPNIKNAASREPEDISKIESSIRFLVSSSAAGSVIGKGGATITEFQSQSGARIQLSRNREFFPGTADRIILLSGTVSAILTALHLILSKVAEDNANGGGGGSGDEQSTKGQVRLIVPNAVCGAVIGKGGATIRSFVDDSGAAIKLSSQDQALPGVTDRVITISGTLEQQLRAVALILTKVSEDPSYLSYANVPLSYTVYTAAAAAGALPTPGFGSALHQSLPAGGFPAGGRQSAYAAPAAAPVPYPSRMLGKAPLVAPAGLATSITVAVPDEHVGAMVGKGGRTITEIQQVTGVHIKLSDRGDFVEGTNHRKVTITGTSDAVVAAQQFISQKIQQSLRNSPDIDKDRDYSRQRPRDRDWDRNRTEDRVERDHNRDWAREPGRDYDRDADRDRDRQRR